MGGIGDVEGECGCGIPDLQRGVLVAGNHDDVPGFGPQEFVQHVLALPVLVGGQRARCRGGALMSSPKEPAMEEPAGRAHSPLPWVRRATEDGTGNWVVVAGTAFYVAEMMNHGSLEEDAANAELIVKAANCHDELVAALKACADRYCRLVASGDCGNWDPEEERHVIAARAILAKVRA